MEFGKSVSTPKSSLSCKVEYTCSKREGVLPCQLFIVHNILNYLLLQSASKRSVLLLFFNNIHLLLEQLVAQALLKCLANDSIIKHCFLSL